VDDGPVVGLLPLSQLPTSREEYDTLLREKGFTQYKTGYLPYSIIDGWQQIRKDFAYWCAAVKGAETATTPEEKAWFEADRRLREKLTIRDIGIWSHYVGDASQPLHVSVHYNGWGNYVSVLETCSAYEVIKGCAYRKPKPERSDGEVRQAWGVRRPIQ
jgi:hypothetical protein